MSAKSLLLVVAGGLAITLLSSAIAGQARATYSEIMGCEHGCSVAAAGWPASYLVDYPGISVVGSANLTGAMVGEDHFLVVPFCLTALFWMCGAALVILLWQRRGRA